jgi:hypothetical protein
MVWIPGDRIKKEIHADFLETYAGAMYDGSLLKGLGNYNDSLGDTCMFQDDIKIGRFIKDKGVNRVILPTDEFCTHDAGLTPELRNKNLLQGNNACFKKMF